MEQIITTTIKTVTVYPDRARVTRVGSAEITPTTTQLLIEKLPIALDVDSLRAGGRGTAQVRILSVDVQKRHYRETPAANVQLLEQRLEQLNDELQANSDARAVLDRQLSYLGGLTQETEQFARGLALGRSQVEGQIALLEFVQNREATLRSEMRTLTREQRDLEKTRQQLQAQMSQLQTQKRLQRYQAVIDIEVVRSGSFATEISYVVHKAGWKPLYDIRLHENEDELTLTALAQVTQRSGEDWQDVQLYFSTARPALNQKLPELKPIYVDELQIRPKMAKQAVAERSRAVRARPVLQAMAAPMMEEAEVVTAQIESAGAAVTFKAAGSADIPGDGSTRKRTLATFQLQPTIDYVSIPRKTDSVFRRATIVNTTATPLLKGGLNLFVDDEFIGRNSLPFTARGDKIELLLGVEERITVSRELTRRDVDKRLLRDRRRIQYGYKIELKNLLADTVTVTVEDQIPVSRHDQIKVNMESIRPQPVEQSALNLVKWQLQMPQESTTTISYTYSVEHPREMRVTGLEK